MKRMTVLIVALMLAGCGPSGKTQDQRLNEACSGHDGVRGTSANGQVAICNDGTATDY